MADSQTTLCLELSEDAARAMSEIRRLGRLRTDGDAVAAALGSELYFQERRADGWRVFIEKDGVTKEVWP